MQNNGVCPRWIVDNFERYSGARSSSTSSSSWSPSVPASRSPSRSRCWPTAGAGSSAPITQVTGILYTIPSLAVFFLLLPITGRGFMTAVIALTAYTLLIIFRNIITGLDNVPADARDAGVGMGLTDHQLLWRVELPLALPEIMAGLRIATTTTVGLATLAFFAGAGGLGEQIYADLDVQDQRGRRRRAVRRSWPSCSTRSCCSSSVR